MSLYAEIVLPTPRGAFTYEVPASLEASVSPGVAVAVPFGRSKTVMGIVWRTHPQKPPFETREVAGIVYDRPLLDTRQMAFWEWVAAYYMCSLGEVMRFALPSALKPEGTSYEELIADRYRPLTKKHIALHPDVGDMETLNRICEELRRSRAQYAAMMEFLTFVPDGKPFGAEVSRDSLDASSVIINKLVQKNILAIHEREEKPFGEDLSFGNIYLPKLTAGQATALEEIRQGFADHRTMLLHGVTGAGKTEIYMHLIAENLAAGRSVLYLMPEIAMTSQLVQRIWRVFGGRVIVYHSAMSDRTRAEAYLRLQRSMGGELILGVRSSVFLPMPSPGLVVVDEEHDASYKQNDTPPRYNARDCVVYASGLWGSKCLLASATPSIESYSNALSGKYGLVTLSERYGDAHLPQIYISDTLSAVKRGERKTHFNKLLLDKMDETLAAGRQVMLFQNRRGFSPYTECPECGWVAKCPRCGVTLTFHKQRGKMMCHACGYSLRPKTVCPDCGKAEPQMKGFGTEKVEEELTKLYPEARIARLDSDVAASGGRFKSIISAFERGDTDILVGTQMITKGFDFPGLSLVGILNADNLLNFPDFRASERAFQIMTQVVGRAGRSDDSGEAVIQTAQPDNDVIRQVQTMDYEGMVRAQLIERRAFGYPPYGRLVVVVMKHSRQPLLESGSMRLAAMMREKFGDRVFGPHVPMVERTGRDFVMNILLKVEGGRSFAEAKTLLSAIIAAFSATTEWRYISISCNVDPQ